MQNALAKVVRGNTTVGAAEVLQSLHWLPVEYRILFKTAKLVHSCLCDRAPVHLSSLVEHYVPVRSLRSSDAHLLIVPRFRLDFGAKAFRVAGPVVWNSLPAELRSSFNCSKSVFNRRLKTYYCGIAFI